MSRSDPPVEGVVWSGERRRWEFVCGCFRVQGYASQQAPGSGVDVEDAELFGWRKVGGEWKCPFCTGSLGNLKKVLFGRGESDLRAVIEAVFGSRDEDGYPCVDKAIESLNDRGISWDPTALWTMSSLLSLQNNRRRTKALLRRLRLTTMALVVVLIALAVNVANMVLVCLRG